MIGVHPLLNYSGVKCSREAVLTSQSSHTTKLSTIIIAEEQGTYLHFTHSMYSKYTIFVPASTTFPPATGQTLRCDVFVDTISRIDITTRTRELLLEEEPERFEVQAFDDEGERLMRQALK